MKKPPRLFTVCIAAATAAVIVLTGVIGIPLWRNNASAHILREDNAVYVTSPDDSTSLCLSVIEGRLCYRVERDGHRYINDSPMGLTVSDTAYGVLSSTETIQKSSAKLTTRTREVLGRTALADTPCVYAVFDIGGDAPFVLETMVFDNGAAFRYRLPDEGDRLLQSEETTFALPDGSGVYAGEAHSYYESVIKYYDPMKRGTAVLGTPVTVRAGDYGYAAVLEGNLQHYPGLKLGWKRAATYAADLGGNEFAVSGEIVTPWRIIAVANDLNELVNNTIVYQVCDEADKAIYGDWVKPGRAVWSWITGRTTDSVTYTIAQDYTDCAAKLGFEYNLIDEGWVNWEAYTTRLKALSEQGAPYEVGQLLWTGVNTGASFGGGIDSADEAYAFLDFLDTTGMKGGKIDFFPTESNVPMGVDIYTDILRYAAEKQLVVNFHGCNKPSGLDTTYPNELNREAIHGLEATAIENRSYQARMFVTQPFVRNLAGHADYTPAVNSAFHMAQLVLTDAPLQVIGSDAQDILSSPALEMIKSVPTVWEETVVLEESRIGQSAVFARKSKGGSWFVGGINSSADSDNIRIELSNFLGEGTYRCELWTDKGTFPVSTVSDVTADDVLTVPFEKLSGFILRFDKVTLSQYGGEITEPITVTVADDTAVSYAVDTGSGIGSYTPIASGDAITLSQSATVYFKITKGPDKGAVSSYRFNKLL